VAASARRDWRWKACWTLDAARPGSAGMGLARNVEEPELVFAEVVAQLEVPTLPGQPLAAALIRWLHRSLLVLLVDNFEHILGATKRLTDLLDACEDLKLLVTSQARLSLRPERALNPGILCATAWSLASAGGSEVLKGATPRRQPR
jgi:hypothetical protein